MKTLCIYHANCADGLGAAWAVHRALGDNVEFHAASYGEDPPIPDIIMHHVVTGAKVDILIVDFSYPLPVLRAMAQEARSVLVLDHHKTAQEDLQSVALPPIWKNWLELPAIVRPDNLAAIFDLNRSGAGLTWDYLHPFLERPLGAIVKPPRPRIIDLIEDRDLWRFKHDPETRQFHAALMSYDTADLPAMFERLDEWHSWTEDCYGVQNGKNVYYTGNEHEHWHSNLSEGSAILRAQSQLITSILHATRRIMRIAGYAVECANVPASLASEAGNLLCKDMQGSHGLRQVPQACFSATYYDGADGRRHFSLRSPEGGADVGKIAKEMAAHFNFLTCEHFVDFKYEWKGEWVGGGHEHAAGFDAPIGWEGE